MKRKITFFVILTIILSGCASLSGPKKAPRCNGRHTRILNRDKWDWQNKGIVLREKIAKPVTAPIILNTLENENAASLKPVNQATFSDKTVEAAREKQ
ncbi:type IV secretion system protein VirB7 [Bartonella phoceensis]|uniref:type IV secretion system protein VirB7 n=1 Tax=Bartonella phoceensis TaxID=270249 RepID=UPI001ABA5E65|nr:type IV secretion system protein VirB7 [Bartonella phoceensis]